MRTGALPGPRLVTWQSWISFFRLLAALYCAVIMSLQLNDVSRFLKFYNNGRLALGIGSFQLALCIILALNDAFMITIDYKRTNTYMGCVATQVTISIIAIIITILALSLQPEWDTYAWLLMYQVGAEYLAVRHRSRIGFLLIGIPTLWTTFLSLCLLVVVLWPLFILRPRPSISQLWNQNTKEVFMGLNFPSKTDHTISISGHSRDVPLLVSSGIITAGRRTKQFFINLLFRRVSPVETRTYAFSRNIFSLFAITFLIVRTITALLTAQNEIGTRMISTACSNDDSRRRHRIQVLVEYKLDRLNPKVLPNMVLVKSGDSGGSDCAIHRNQSRLYSQGELNVTVFNCGISTEGPFVDYVSPEPQVFHVEVRRVMPNASAPLLSNDMPRVWLLNGDEQSQGMGRSYVDTSVHAARTYLPAWELHRGFHLEAEAKLITRKTIKSSIWRDVLLHSEPILGSSSLYPIVESPIGMFNYPNNSIATARVTVTLKPGFMYFRNQAGVPSPVTLTAGVCDIIEDYRSGTVLDVIGSIGGLFALLQTAHVLLFGRPLIWGMTGAKIITPFGLLGACSSSGFKRRLRERYHKKSEKDQSEKLLVGPFLRDFVIDFGPADIEQNYHAPPHSSGTADNESMAGSQVPLTRLDYTALAPQNDDDVGQRSTRNRYSVEDDA